MTLAKFWLIFLRRFARRLPYMLVRIVSYSIIDLLMLTYGSARSRRRTPRRGVP